MQKTEEAERVLSQGQEEPSGFAEAMDGDRPNEDQELVDRIRQGDHAAFEALFRVYHQDLLRFAHFYVKRLAVAEELVQDIFHNIWQRRRSWKPRGALRSYLYGAVRNHANKYLRGRKVRDRYRTRKQLEADRRIADETPERELRRKELSEAVRGAIAMLPERRRQVFKLSRQQGLTYAEIAAVLGISENTVEVHMVRALKFLRKRVSDLL